MVKDLYRLAEQDGVIVERWPLSSPLDAIYIKEPGIPPVVAISTRIAEGTAAYNTLLAHELGHHFTTAGEVASCQRYSYGDALVANRAEYRATRWAAECLLPLNELREALDCGILERWELAEHFGVTEDLVDFRLSVIRDCLDEERLPRQAAESSQPDIATTDSTTEDNHVDSSQKPKTVAEARRSPA